MTGDVSPNLRRAGTVDVEDVRRLVVAAYTPWIEVIGIEPFPMFDDYAALVAAGEVWVAEDDDIVCVLVLQLAPDHLLINNIAVAPAAQGTGVGAQLLAFAEAQARELGRAEVQLYTNELMASNIAYYERHGYVETGRDGEPPRRRIFFTKRLAQQDVAGRGPTGPLLMQFGPEHAEAVRAWAGASPFSRAWLGETPETGLGSIDVAPDIQRFVLLVEGELRGYGELWVDEEEDEVELAHLLVDPDHRRRGFGTGLVTALVPRARELAGDVLLRVDADNAAAIALYERLGFSRLGPEELEVFNAGQPQAYVWMRLPRD